MALAIKEESGGWRIWHIGDPTPEDLGRVVLMQADGDELNFILTMMEVTTRPINGIAYTKMGGLKCQDT